jgi:dihydroorotate dehydrogenase
MTTPYRALARPALFRVGGGDAEAAHEWTLRRLASLSRHPAALRVLRAAAPRGTPRTLFGLRFPNPVGLAAGMDKDGRALPAWAALGFGFIEVGTVTARPQPGNPRPRLFRLPADEAIVNRMGFNNEGAAALAARLAALRPLGIPLGISLGKSKVVPLEDAVEDYVAALRAVLPHADYLAVNVSSPNTLGLRGLQDRDQLAALLAALRAEAGATPVLVKIAPDLTEHAIGEVLDVCAEHGVAGLIATNTTIERRPAGLAPASERSERASSQRAPVPARDEHEGEPGGLSGRPLTRRALEVVTFVGKRSELPVIGVGGIMSAEDATRMFDAGASLVQLYTGLIYQGPALLRAVVRASR